MKRQLIRLTRIAFVLMVSGWVLVSAIQPENVSAQGVTDLNTILARATVKGFLTSLTFDTPSATLTDFYLSDDITGNDVTQALNGQPVDSFEILAEEWLSDEVYQARVTIQPGGQVLVADVSKPAYRWQIMNLVWADGSAPAPSGATSTSPVTGSDNASTATAAGATPTAEVLSSFLNVRAGPGTNYEAVDILERGDRVDIVGQSTVGEWYEVARDGQTIGWISAKPQYVTSSLNAGAAPASTAPQVAAPGPPASTTTGQLIIQPKSGGPFYMVEGNDLRYISTGIDPALSPDGSRVAFTRWESGEVGAVWIHQLATGNEWTVLGESKEAKSPSWSPDGSKIIVSYQQGGQPYLERKCTSGDAPRGAIDVNRGSETGRVCYTLEPDTHWKLRQVDLTTGTYEDMASATYSYAPTWDTVNDWRVIFADAINGLQQLDVNRNVLFPFTGDLRDRAPVFSPDGSQVAVSYKQDSHWEVYTISAADGSRKRLTPISVLGQSFNSAAPAWSPDGSQIAFITDRNGQWEFYIMNADGSNPRPLLSPAAAAQITPEYNGVDERLITWGQ